MKSVFVSEQDQVDIPGWVHDFDSFRRWLHSGTFPEQGRICLINGTVWVDLSMERFFVHGQVKTEITRVLANLMKETRFGRFAPDGTRYSHLPSAAAPRLTRVVARLRSSGLSGGPMAPPPPLRGGQKSSASVSDAHPA